MAEMTPDEKFPSPPNLPPGKSPAGKARFLLRQFADLQVSSVLAGLKPWLEKIEGSVLEVGCGAQPYRHLVPGKCAYQGLDWSKADEHFDYMAPDTVYYSGSRFPFEDSTFSCLFHTEVLEHIYDTATFLGECRRVLENNGLLFLSVPFQARYHYKPVDFWRFTPSALHRLLTGAGFKDIRITPRGNDITVAVYKNVSLIYRWLQAGPGGKLLGLILSPALLVLLPLGHLSLKAAIGSEDDCLGYNVEARAG